MKAGHWFQHMDYHQQTGTAGDTSTVGVYIYTAHFHGETQKKEYQEQTKQINGN